MTGETTLGGEVHLGKVEGTPTETLEKVKVLFAQADIKADVPDNMLHY